jgi:hypothetical protein
MKLDKSTQSAEQALNQTATPNADQIERRTIGNAERKKFNEMHTLHIGSHVYKQQLKQAFGSNMDDTAFSYVADTLLRMNTRDPFEEMLVMQALWSHTRLGRLNNIANQQTQPNHLQIVNDACDGAANTFRRQMLALAEYRQPRKTGDSFTAIKQANFAQQQVVQNGENGKLPEQKPSNEQGSESAAPKALSSHNVGTGIPSGERPAGETVGAIDRAEDAGRLAARG